MNSNLSVTATFNVASGYTYAGTDQVTTTISSPGPSGCTPSQILIKYGASPPATLVASTPLESPGSFSGNLTINPYAVTYTYPAITCGGLTIPGTSTATEFPVGGVGLFSGTSDGHLISFSQDTQNLLCAGTVGGSTTCSVSGTVSAVAENVVVTLNINSSNNLAVGSGSNTTETLTLTKK